MCVVRTAKNLIFANAAKVWQHAAASVHCLLPDFVDERDIVIRISMQVTLEEPLQHAKISSKRSAQVPAADLFGAYIFRPGTYLSSRCPSK
jgi:hypothetical protein